MSEKRKLALHWQILIGMACGVIGGLILRGLASAGVVSLETMEAITALGQGAGQLFLALLSMVVVPLVFTSLVSSMTGLRGQEGLRKMGALTLGYYLVTSMLAITVGLIMSNLIQPGKGVDYSDLLAKARAAGQHSVKSGSQRQVEQLTIDVVRPGEPYAFTFDKRLVTITATAGATADHVRDALITAFKSEPELLQTASAVASGRSIRFRANAPGVGFSLKEDDPKMSVDTMVPNKAEPSATATLAGIFFRMVPQNVIDAASNNRNMLAVIFFALMLGLFINKVEEPRARRLSDLFDDFFEVMMKMTHMIIALAPYGIFGYLVFVAATTDPKLAVALAKYMLVVFLGLSFHALITLPVLSWLLTRQSPLALARAVWPALATAFSTASSSGTLPLTMKCLNDAGVEKRVTSFVLPLGATVNMDGTALYEAAAVLFIAQMLGDLSLAEQVIVAFTALLASVGAAGIPHAGTVMMVIVLQAVNLPTEAVLTILAVDRVLDMMRTAVNVWSDSNATAVVNSFELKKAQLKKTPAAPVRDASA